MPEVGVRIFKPFGNLKIRHHRFPIQRKLLDLVKDLLCMVKCFRDVSVECLHLLPRLEPFLSGVTQPVCIRHHLPCVDTE